ILVFSSSFFFSVIVSFFLFFAFFFFFTYPSPFLFYTLSLHDALPISPKAGGPDGNPDRTFDSGPDGPAWISDVISGRTLRSDGRSEEHTSELQSRFDLVCRLLLEKKNKTVLRVIINNMLELDILIKYI